MHGIGRMAAILAAALAPAALASPAAAAPAVHAPPVLAPAAPARLADESLLAPPPGAGPLVVHARFDLRDINAIDDGSETFELSGVLTLRWRDARQAFDPALAGVDEKVLTGAYQFDEVAPAWYPQVVLVNAGGAVTVNGVVQRTAPDGTTTLIQTLVAVAEAELDMFRFPFDRHRLEAEFEVLGADRDELRIEVDPDAADAPAHGLRVPEWDVGRTHVSVRDLPAPFAGPSGLSSALVVGVDVRRQSFYTLRLVVVPLIVIVLLSFSVFWMDRSSLGDRLSVSFIGILTGVAYQLVTSEHLPRIAYVTLMHAFLSLSFLAMCGTVVINLLIAVLDRRGRSDAGDRLDRRCRWAFPLVYAALLCVMLVVAFGSE